jgi:putative DNA primase/helicase
MKMTDEGDNIINLNWQQAVRSLPEEVLGLIKLKGEASSVLFVAFIKTALQRNVDEDVMIKICIDQNFNNCAIFKHVQANGGEPYIKQFIITTVNTSPQVTRRTIQIVNFGADTDKYWRETERSLIEKNSPVYVRGTRLVQPIWHWQKADERNVLVSELEHFSEGQLADMIAHNAVIFQRYDARARDWRNIDPPPPIVKGLLGAHHYLLPSIIGIITSPTMRPDGSLLTEPGYDPQTQLWYRPSDNIKLPAIPNNPDKDDALSALAKLNDLLQEFPFDNEMPVDWNEMAEVRQSRRSVSRSVALAAIMTTVARGAFQSAVPLFVVSANKARTGKSFLVNTIGVIATGHIPVPTSGSFKKEEFEKRVEASAMTGRSIMHFNNLPNGMVIDSERLAEVSTEGIMHVRKLGKHEEVLCDCRATTVFVNGNNILLSSDLVFRAATCRLNTQTERPEERKFNYNPLERVRANRGEYIAAVFTIIRAFKYAGSPLPMSDEMKRVAGFEQWSKLIQQPLIWLDMSDPFGSMEDMIGMDPQQEQIGQVIEVLKKYFSTDERFDVALCVKLAEEQEGTQYGPRYKNPELRDLLTNRGRIDGQYFGRTLMNLRDQIKDGWQIKLLKLKTSTKKFVLAGPPHIAPTNRM